MTNTQSTDYDAMYEFGRQDGEADALVGRTAKLDPAEDGDAYCDGYRAGRNGK